MMVGDDDDGIPCDHLINESRATRGNNGNGNGQYHTFKGAALAAGAGAALEAGLEKTEAWKGSVKFQKQ